MHKQMVHQHHASQDGQVAFQRRLSHRHPLRADFFGSESKKPTHLCVQPRLEDADSVKTMFFCLEPLIAIATFPKQRDGLPLVHSCLKHAYTYNCSNIVKHNNKFHGAKTERVWQAAAEIVDGVAADAAGEAGPGNRLDAFTAHANPSPMTLCKFMKPAVAPAARKRA